MAKYWIYINDKVMGPYELDELIRVAGFSRQTPVSVDDYSGQVGQWISPAHIPELARIFQKVDEMHDAPTPPPRAIPKSKPKMPARLTPVAPPAEESDRFSGAWIWALIFVAVAAGSIYYGTQRARTQSQIRERQEAQAMIENAPLPSASRFSTLRQFLQEKQIASRWEFERTAAGLQNVTVSWPSPNGSGARLPVHAFEVNLQAKTVRGLNTAAIRLLAEGFPRSDVKTAAAPPPPSKPKHSPGDLFPGAINDRRLAFEQGDFDSVWEAFSRRRKSEMEQGGISAASFSRMQKMTYRSGAGLQQAILKTQSESETVRLVLMRQSQPKHPDIFVKQRWVWEENAWRLDQEEKRAAAVPASASAENAAESAPDRSPASPAAKPVPMNLPGLSDPSR